ncbi:HlyD family type I secretion periplasmic adaptor subunit [Magnetospirillum moscoviense]|uniref:Membrane fusion protein (MFP) family protein n=1 Tax=Magnetospirillum moscoviense TaxID=1437059 RepID=A0A178MTN2_9PROT|nr:HlyD family type I secretion periplasmic adaptor subunit [Magnetospirillum moscoviense]OAN51521.1 hypothetical protein A6A05_01275 [Magnetospirillum moscoviense]
MNHIVSDPVHTVAANHAQTSAVAALAPSPSIDQDRHNPGRAARISAMAILAIFGLGLVWAASFRVAIMAVADGRVVPPERVQVLGHAEGGRVAALHVRTGQHVTAGDALIDLDPTAARADLAQLKAEGEVLSGDILRLDAERLGQVPDFGGLPAAIGSQQTALFKSRQHRHAEDLRVAQAEITANRAVVIGLTAALAPLRLRMQARRGLSEKGLASSFLVNEDEARVAELAGRLQEARANEEKARHRLSSIDVVRQEDIALALKDAHAKLESHSSQRPKLEKRLSDMRIVAPVTGTVKSAAVTGPGSTLRPGEAAVEIVPDDARRVIAVKLPAGEVGHVRIGQTTRITLLPADGGLRPLEGIVSQIAPDSSADDRSGQFHYLVEITPAATEFTGDAAEIYPLVPGVPVSVAIITGTRTVLAALMGPLFADLDRAVSER